MHAIRLIQVSKKELPNIAKIPRTDASDAMNCFPWLLIVSGISEQVCLEDIIVHSLLLMRRSDTNLTKYEQDLKQNLVILIWAMSCLAACIVRLCTKGKMQEETGISMGSLPHRHSRKREVKGGHIYAPPRCSDTCL